MHGRARMDFRNHLFIDSRTRNRETLLDVIRMTKIKSYLIVHEETLSDIGKGCTQNEHLSGRTSGRLKGMVSFEQVYYSVSGFRIIRKLIYSVRSSDRNAWVEAASDQ